MGSRTTHVIPTLNRICAALLRGKHDGRAAVRRNRCPLRGCVYQDMALCKSHPCSLRQAHSPPTSIVLSAKS